MKIKVLQIVIALIMIVILSGCEVSCDEYYKRVEDGYYNELMNTGQLDGMEFEVYYNNYPEKDDCGFVEVTEAIIFNNYFVEFSNIRYSFSIDEVDLSLREFLREYGNDTNIDYIINLRVELSKGAME